MAAKKKMMTGSMKNAQDAKNWILATNPGNNNECFCFFIAIPNSKWVIVNNYKTQPECTQFIPSCRAYFKNHPNALVEVHEGAQHAVGKVKKKFAKEKAVAKNMMMQGTKDKTKKSKKEKKSKKKNKG